MRSIRIFLAACVVGAGVSGCSTDPFERPGTWQPVGANEINLRQMAADPTHLLEGIGATGERAVSAVPPIRRLDAGERPEPPQVRTSGGR